MAASQTLLIALKGALKAKSFTYSDLVSVVGVSETSVKRMMSGKTPITLDRIDLICEFAQIDLFELMKLAKAQPAKDLDHLTYDQESLLAKNEDDFLVFYSLAKGLQPDEIYQKYKITKSALQQSLHRLERSGLFEVHPENRIKFLVPRSIRWIEGGPLALRYQSELEQDFLESDFSGELQWKKFVTIPLSARSKAQFIRKFRELIAQMNEQSKMDLLLDKKLKSTMTTFIGAREWTPSLLSKFIR